jgi:hypothetical protein
MTVNRFDHLGHGQGGHAHVDGAGVFPLHAAAWQSSGGLDTSLDPVEAYFECISTCSLDDGECVTTCTEILRQHS